MAQLPHNHHQQQQAVQAPLTLDEKRNELRKLHPQVCHEILNQKRRRISKIQNLQREKQNLQRENQNLQGENQNLQGENQNLQQDNQHLQRSNKNLHRANQNLQKANKNLQNQLLKSETNRNKILEEKEYLLQKYEIKHVNGLDDEQSVCLIQRNIFLEKKFKEMERKIRTLENGGVEPPYEDPNVVSVEEIVVEFEI